MRIHDRESMREYAKEICLPMLEHAADTPLSAFRPTVLDHRGYTVTWLEDLCRPMWGLAGLLKDAEEPLYIRVNGKKTDVCAWVRSALLNGVTPGNADSWDRYREDVGRHTFDFQALTELAGLLICCCLCRDRLWDPYTAEEKRRIADWILDACEGECRLIAGNNHVWFPLFCLLALKKLGFCGAETDRFITEGLERLDTMYMGNGWYCDGVPGRIDYYEAWSLHAYPLIWCLLESDNEECAERRAVYMRRTEEFLRQYVYCFDANGAYPAFGRSLSYRFAAVCVFPLAVLCGCDVDAPLAGSITMRNVGWFAELVRMRDGLLPAGYLYDAPGLIDNYTSEGGPYWCAKTFLALLLPAEHPFWSAPEAAVPCERGEYIVRLPHPDMPVLVSGGRNSGVTMFSSAFQYYDDGKYRNRFHDMAAWYNKFAYNSLAGFGTGTRDRVSLDSMISLQTPDESMESHRHCQENRGIRDGMLLSSHRPFANDPGTVIGTAILPLPHGWHARLQRVTLSQPYSVREGGFSIGLWDDGCCAQETADVVRLRGGGLTSVLRVCAEVPVRVQADRYAANPGMHLMAPLSFCPLYETDVLGAGTYLFLSVYGVFEEEPQETPEIALRDGIGVVRLDGMEYRMDPEAKA